MDNIILNSNEKKKDIYIETVKEWIVSYEWDYFLTLTFKHPVYDKVKVSKAIEKFINRLSSLAFGSRSKKRIKAFSTIESGSLDSSLHVHMMVQDPRPLMLKENRCENFNLRNSVIESWLKSSSSAGHPASTGSSDEWMKKVTDVEGCIGYMVKEVGNNLDNCIAWDQLNLKGRKHVL
mgnify:FL=1